MGRVNELSMNHPISEEVIRAEYFQWLCGLVMVDEPDHSYWILAKALHNTAFYWSIRCDENRAFDGMKLRDIFAEEHSYCGFETLSGPCSVFELLIGLALRIESTLTDPENGDRTVNWFWEMIENLGLEKFTDADYYRVGGDYVVGEILTKLLRRWYFRNGEGGLFPLKHSRKDQRKVELWYQMSAYLMENYNLED